MPSADLYLRISLDRSGDELGVDRQESACRALCERNAWAVRNVYADNDISATTGKHRPGFEALLTAKPERIVVWHTDRLVRLTKDLERVIALGVNVHAVTAGHLDLSNPSGRAVARTVTAWATYEGEQKAERQTAAARQRAERGRSWSATRPFGFTADGEHLDDVEADFTRRAYSELLSGGNLSAMAREWTAAGMTTTKGNPWTQSKLTALLRQPRNAGLRSYRGEIVGAAVWEPIVDETTYRSVLSILTDPARRTGGEGRTSYLLTGLARCGVCDDGTTVRIGQRPDGRKLYRCTASSHLGRAQTDLDDLVAAYIVRRLSREDAADLRHDDTLPDVAALRDEAAQCRARLDTLAVDYADGVLSSSQMRTASGRLRSRLEAAEAKMAHGDRTALLDGVLGEQAAAVWPTLALHRRRGLVELLVDVTILRSPRGPRFDPAYVRLTPTR